MDKKSRTKVKVIIRVRPPLNDEAVTCVHPDKSKNCVEIFNHRNIQENLQYDFSTVYDKTATQKEIFDECVEPSLGNSLKGQNVSIFAYGPTGAGKTYTMLGSESDPGITPRVIKWLFQRCGTQDQSIESDTPKTTITFSFLEIYNEKVQDLLAADITDLHIREDSKHNIFVAGLTEKVVDSFETLQSYFGPACSKRSVAATNLNEHSSRSHSIVLLKVTRKFKDKEYIGKIHLIDLAGSEDNRRTGNKGMRLKESGAINKSLFALGEVVDAINKKFPRIPYRNSKLTRLLQDSLGGSCHSLMVTNIAPEEHYYYDTYCTLNFASKSKKITNTCITNINHIDAISKPSLLKRNASSESNLMCHKKLKRDDSTISTTSSNSSPWKSSVNERIEELEKQIHQFRELNKQSSSPVKEENSPTHKLRRSSSRLSSARINSSASSFSTSQADIEKDLSCLKNTNLKLTLVPVDTDESPDIVCATPIIKKRKNALKDKSNVLLNMFNNRRCKKYEKRIVDSGPSHSPLFLYSAKKKRMSKNGETPHGKDRYSGAISIAKGDPVWQEKRNEAFLTTLNSASTKELQQLHTVGAKRAKLIFEWRELNGPFQEIEALKDIPGFTCKYYDKFLKNNLITQ